MNTSEANLKRLQAVKGMKKDYQARKSLLKAALSDVDTKPTNKIVFDYDDAPQPKKQGRIQNGEKSIKLFDDEHDDDDNNFEGNFEVKEYLQGKKGQKLLELQSRYKNDSRFKLNEKFLEEEEGEENDNTQTENIPAEEESIEAEKIKEFEILEQVIGKKVTPKFLNKEHTEKETKMLRFDPTRPEHAKYILPMEKPEKKKNKVKYSDLDFVKEKKAEETEKPEVSKEVFYKVPENLKENFQGTEGFSLLQAFGDVEESQEEKEGEIISKKKLKSKQMEKNPFKYDSSDDDEADDIPHKSDGEPVKQVDVKKDASNAKRASFWQESFFIKEDDYRIQEGFDFLEKMKLKSSEEKEFGQVRHSILKVARAKMKNNQRKDRMFKRKLGGSKNRRKKQIRIKKALNR